MSMRISIAMATYNGAKYLREQLDSFLHQTRLPDELVVCDDGSSDATLEILEVFRQQVPFSVHIYRNETNLGYIKNFEKAMSLCAGDIIFLSDQDDFWLSNKLEVVEKLFALKPNLMVVVNDQYIADSSLKLSTYTTLGNAKAVGLTESWLVAGCCTAIRRVFFPIVLPIPENAHGHDAWINKLAEALGLRYVHAVPLQYYRRHGENTSNSFASKLGKVSIMDLLLEYGIKDERIGWQRDVDHYVRYQNRIADRKDELADLGLADAYRSAINSFACKIDSLKERIYIASLARPIRLLRVIRFWANGSYGHFSGWKSAVKDILRP